MGAKEDWRDAAESSLPGSSSAPLRGAALAAGMLENACAPGPDGDTLRLQVVRGLARDLKAELEALADGEPKDAVEGALRAADVANLAASAVPELSHARVPEAAAATHLAAGFAQALVVLTEADDTGELHAKNSLKDARSAAWRARFAARQVDEFLEGRFAPGSGE